MFSKEDLRTPVKSPVSHLTRLLLISPHRGGDTSELTERTRATIPRPSLPTGDACENNTSNVSQVVGHVRRLSIDCDIQDSLKKPDIKTKIDRIRVISPRRRRRGLNVNVCSPKGHGALHHRRINQKNRVHFDVPGMCTVHQLARLLLLKYREHLVESSSRQNSVDAKDTVGSPSRAIVGNGPVDGKRTGVVRKQRRLSVNSKKARQFMQQLPNEHSRALVVRWAIFIGNSNERIDRSYPKLGRDIVLSDVGRTQFVIKWRPWCDGFRAYAFEFPFTINTIGDDVQRVEVDFVGWNQLRRHVFSRINKRHSHDVRQRSCLASSSSSSSSKENGAIGTTAKASTSASSFRRRSLNDDASCKSGSVGSAADTRMGVWKLLTSRTRGAAPKILVSWIFPSRKKQKKEKDDCREGDRGTFNEAPDNMHVVDEEEADGGSRLIARARFDSCKSTDTSDGEWCPNIQETSRRPQWVPDSASMRCMVKGCDRSFSKVPFSPSRKHHCRACGCLVCAKHSQKRASLPELGYGNLVRVCDTCYARRARDEVICGSGG